MPATAGSRKSTRANSQQSATQPKSASAPSATGSNNRKRARGSVEDPALSEHSDEGRHQTNGGGRALRVMKRARTTNDLQQLDQEQDTVAEAPPSPSSTLAASQELLAVDEAITANTSINSSAPLDEMDLSTTVNLADLTPEKRRDLKGKGKAIATPRPTSPTTLNARTSPRNNASTVPQRQADAQAKVSAVRRSHSWSSDG